MHWNFPKRNKMNYKDEQVRTDSFGHAVFKPAYKRRGISTLDEYVKCCHVCPNHTVERKNSRGKINHIWTPTIHEHKAIPDQQCRWPIFYPCESCSGFPYNASRKDKLKHLPASTQKAIIDYVKKRWNR